MMMMMLLKSQLLQLLLSLKELAGARSLTLALEADVKMWM